jgi:hypothetical protein
VHDKLRLTSEVALVRSARDYDGRAYERLGDERAGDDGWLEAHLAEPGLVAAEVDENPGCTRKGTFPAQ